MGITTNSTESVSLADALFPKVRQRVLSVLFGAPDRSFYANEVIALASAAGLLNVTKQGNQKHYQANANAPVFAELRSLVLKSMGLADVLFKALMPLSEQIKQAFIYGSVARQQDTAHSDVDLMVISDTLAYGELFGALESATLSLGRKVNPTLYTQADWDKRLQNDSVFVIRVWEQPKIWLIGSEEEDHANVT